MTADRRRVIVIGGGAAGLLAAGEAARCGAHVVILEKMTRPGRKLRITGKGRCNLTNIADKREFIGHFGPRGKFLHQAFARFFSDDLIALMESLGVEIKSERGGRVFPINDDATLVVDALVSWVHRLGILVRTNSPVESIRRANGSLAVHLSGGEVMNASAVILATGGASYPATGSTGDGYRLARVLGHTIVPPRPALVPLVTQGPTAEQLQGLTLKNVNASLTANGAEVASRFGDMLFTHYGVTGPIILSLSRVAVDALSEGREVNLTIDLKPAVNDVKLDARLLREIQAHGTRQVQNLLKELLPASMIPVCCRLTGIPAEKTANQITTAERKLLHRWLKGFSLKVIGHRDYNEAIVTAGGVSLDEIDPKTMASRMVPGLFVAGELLDIDGDTGGYNLQAAFSTGWLAGRNAATMIKGE